VGVFAGFGVGIALEGGFD